MKCFAFILGLISVMFGVGLWSSQASAGWMANADFSSCPRKFVANTPGSEGPFNSESDCLARVGQVEREQNMACVRYSCVNQSGGASDGGSSQPGHQMDTHIGNAISAGISGDISPTDAAGLAAMGLIGNALLTPSAPQRQKTSAEIEAEQVAAQRAAIENARRERERQERKDAQVAPILALLDPLPTDQELSKPAAMSDFYTKGFEHASQCISQNAGTACSGVAADQQQNCVNDYRAGYESGHRQKVLVLDEAFRIGLGAGTSGALANAASDERAAGPCRTEWIESYNRGYFQGKHQK